MSPMPGMARIERMARVAMIKSVACHVLSLIE